MKTNKNINLSLNESKNTITEIAEKIINRKHNANITCASTYLRNLNTLAIIKKSNIANIPIQNISSDNLQNFFIH